MNLNDILHLAPYSLRKKEKEELMSSCLTKLCKHHYSNCEPYRRMIDAVGFDPEKEHHYPAIPFLPVQLFKDFDLSSVSQEKIIKTVTSSGTTGQGVSRIFLDKASTVAQRKVLSRIVSSFIGDQRLPLIILDAENAVKTSKDITARTAGILGFSLFGTKRIFALDEHMNLDVERVQAFLRSHQNEPILVFGFTYIVYLHFYKALIRSGVRLDLSNAILVHGGGWKKLEREAVSPKAFMDGLNTVCGIQRVHDYYGMAEQTGTIAMQCKFGHYHTPIYSDILIRRASDFSLADFGEEGIIQVLSILPKSYPGHCLLTTDIGTLLGEDDCPCGRSGKYFKVNGRLKSAEIRGCSDTYEESA